MFERWTDVLSAVAGAAAIGYMVYEIGRRQRKLRDIFHVLDDEDALMTERLEELVRTGAVRPFAAAAA
jgi:hypothetical protein